MDGWTHLMNLLMREVHFLMTEAPLFSSSCPLSTISPSSMWPSSIRIACASIILTLLIGLHGQTSQARETISNIINNFRDLEFISVSKVLQRFGSNLHLDFTRTFFSSTLPTPLFFVSNVWYDNHRALFMC